MTEAWRLDAWDARAGFAFASSRDADLLTEAPQMNRPAVIVAPPSFQPEWLATRSLGFAASRGSCQLGLYVGGAEVGFPSLEALIDFVRRAYMSGGGGDAPGPGAPSVPRPREGGGPEIGPLVPVEGARADRVGELRSALIGMQALCATLSETSTFGADQTVDYETVQAPSLHDSVAGVVDLAWGAGELVLELIRRLDEHALMSDKMMWLRSAVRLTDAIGRLGLSRTMYIDRAFGDRFHADLGKFRHLSESRPPNRLNVERAVDAAERALFIEHGLYFRSWRAADPLDDLCRWPIPGDIAARVGLDYRTASAFQLLSAMNGAPLASLPDDPTLSRCLAIVIFAAAHALSEGESVAPLEASTVSDEFFARATADLTRASLEWLLRQWPRCVFPEKLERLIQGVAQAAYA
jgi:hypothetical protein